MLANIRNFPSVVRIPIRLYQSCWYLRYIATIKNNIQILISTVYYYIINIKKIKRKNSVKIFVTYLFIFTF